MNAALVLLIATLLAATMIVVMLFVFRKSRFSGQQQVISGETVSNDAADGFQRAFAALRIRLAGTGLAERLPYVLLIGEPDSGKTTLLKSLDAGPPIGSASPRSVQWRFLDQGAVIEIPGEFLIASDAKIQSDDSWLYAVRQLARHRPRAPLNGVVLTIAAPQLKSGNESDNARRRVLAAAIRSKLDSLQRETGLVLPIHVIVTKCDQVRGFESFCSSIDRELGNEIFGWANPNTLESAFAPSWVEEAFDSIYDQLSRLQLRTFGSQTPIANSDELFVFPLEFESMRAPLRAFLAEVFRENAYVDSNFFRGIFFCGDSAAVRPAQALATGSGPFSSPSFDFRTPPNGMPAASPGTIAEDSLKLPATPSSSALSAPGRQIAFVRNLFELRILSESQIARPVTRARYAGQRRVFAIQLGLAAFALIFAVGTINAWHRLRDLRDRKFTGLLTAISNEVPNAGPPSMQTAYNLVDTLGSIHASGFRSAFLPLSWGDPIDRDLTDALGSAFARTVFPAIGSALRQRGTELMGSCSVDQPLQPEDDRGSVPVLSALSFLDDPQYVEMDRFVRRYAAWQAAVSHYDKVRLAGLGSFSDLDYLFLYLLGKNVGNADQISASYYYQHALTNSTGSAVTVMDACAQQLGTTLVKNFYSSWFDNNPLLTSVDDVAAGIDDLESNKLQADDQVSELAQKIRVLDGEISRSSNRWITGGSFNAGSYPALSQLLLLRFVNDDLRHEIDTLGNQKLVALKDQLFSSGSEASGAVLEQRGTEVRLSGDVVALEVGLEALLRQNFTGNYSARSPLPDSTVIWNKASLLQATQLPNAYDKFLREQLPLLPPSMRAPVQRIASRDVNQAALSAIILAAEPQNSLDAPTVLLAIRSFSEAVPLLTQLQAELPGSSDTAGLQEILVRQSITLAKWLNAQLDQKNSRPYTLAADVASQQDTRPVSFRLFDVDSSNALEEYLASQRDRLHSMAMDYASPVASYLQSQGLQHAADFDRWSAIVRDVNDYDAKKPGNPIAALETFVRGDLNKITPSESCKTIPTPLPSNDFFYQVRSDIQTAAVAACVQTALHTYRTEIADFFNSKLAGKYPFAPLSPEPGALEADPYEVSEFLDRIGKDGPALEKFFATSTEYHDQLVFLNDSLGLRSMLSATTGGAPAADIVLYFRVDQANENGGNEIIDWNFDSGDGKLHYPGTENSLRWHYGDPLRLTLRYAKDSPDIPRAGGLNPDEQISGRSFLWNSSKHWSLFELLDQHTQAVSDFGMTSQLAKSTLTFLIPVVRDTSRQRISRLVSTFAASAPASQPATRVFLRISFRIPDPKEPREVQVANRPRRAPSVTSTGKAI